VPIPPCPSSEAAARNLRQIERGDYRLVEEALCIDRRLLRQQRRHLLGQGRILRANLRQSRFTTLSVSVDEFVEQRTDRFPHRVVVSAHRRHRR
jgi:hypothetical protein